MIARGTRIIEYTGERIPLARLLADAGAAAGAPVYTFRLNESTVVDGTRGGNEARLINHSCDPNCEVYVFEERLYVYAMRDIARGEELTFDYHLSRALKGATKRGASAAYPCRCGSPKCRGTMLSRNNRKRH